MSRIQQSLRNISRETWLFGVTTTGLLLGILLTLPAWSNARTYPLSPIIPGLSMPGVLHDGLLLFTLLCLGLSLVYRSNRKLLVSVALVSLACLVLLDITRLQPWILHYSAILFLFSFYTLKFGETAILDAARIIIGGIYFWSGIQKLNERFMTTIFPWFTEPIWSLDPDLLLTPLVALGLLVPLIEAGFALGFFSQRARVISVLGSVGMILIVLVSIGPLGHNWNSSVWPWNIAIFSMVLALFWNTSFTMKDFLRRLYGNWLAYGMIFLFWIMPAGNIFGLTDHYLSWSLYSGHAPEAELSGDQLYLASLSPSAEDGVLGYIDWTMSEMNLVPYPEKRVFLSVLSNLCEEGAPGSTTLTVYQYAFFASDNVTEEQLQCTDIE